MKTGLEVFEAMTKKLVSVSPDKSIYDCANIMKKEHIGSLIIEEKGKLLGIVTEQDLVYKIIAKNKDIMDTPVEKVMTKNVKTITPEKDINDAMMEMAKSNVRRLPVVEGEKVIGMLTMKDILKVEPALFDIIVGKFELREEHRKPINIVGENEGLCELCGNFSAELTEQDGAMVCKDCLD